MHERTNVSPISKKTPPTSSPCETVLETEKFECDAEKIRSSERFSRSITPRGRRQPRRRRVHKIVDTENSSKVKFAFILNCTKKKKHTHLHYKLKLKYFY